jgi:acetyl-CoA C-acetyltransferase
VKTLKAAFKKDGTVTAANASTINDGAAAMVVMSGKAAREQGANVLFKIRGFGKSHVYFVTFFTHAIMI